MYLLLSFKICLTANNREKPEEFIWRTEETYPWAYW